MPGCRQTPETSLQMPVFTHGNESASLPLTLHRHTPVDSWPWARANTAWPGGHWTSGAAILDLSIVYLTPVGDAFLNPLTFTMSCSQTLHQFYIQLNLSSSVYLTKHVLHQNLVMHFWQGHTVRIILSLSVIQQICKNVSSTSSKIHFHVLPL